MSKVSEFSESFQEKVMISSINPFISKFNKVMLSSIFSDEKFQTHLREVRSEQVGNFIISGGKISSFSVEEM